MSVLRNQNSESKIDIIAYASLSKFSVSNKYFVIPILYEAAQNKAW
jgi:hypothetical protein